MISTKMTVEQAICEILSQYGVPYVFGMNIYTDLDTSRTRPINIHSEAAAILMAYGFARVSGRPGVAAINRAGSPNTVMGLAEAYNSSGPVIVLQDGQPLSAEGRNGLYAHDQVGFMKTVSKWIADVTVTSRAPDILRRAFRIATSGRPGPVVLNLRPGEEEIEAQLGAEPACTVFPSVRPEPSRALIQEVAELISGAERPCIVAGGGVILSRAWDELRDLAELTQMPVATTISGKGSFSEHHPLSAGCTGGIQGGWLGRGRVAERVVKDSDLVLLIGTRTNQMATSSWTVPDPSATIIHVDIDPAEIGRNYSTRLGIVADAKTAMVALSTALRSRGFTPTCSRTEEIREAMEEWQRDNEPMATSEAVPINPGRLIREIRPFVDSNTILVSDGSSPFMWASSHIPVDAGTTFISPRGTGAIGTGLPMAIGAKLAAPEKRVICFEGDGGLMCGILAELETAARYGLDIVVVVFNNGTYLHEKIRMRGPLAEEMDFLPGIDFAAIARGLCCEGIRVERPGEIGDAMRTALASHRPTLLDVVLDQRQGFPAGAA